MNKTNISDETNKTDREETNRAFRTNATNTTRAHITKLPFLVLCIIFLILLAIFFFRFREKHTFTLSNGDEAITGLKSEEIQPVFGTVTVWGTQDTDVWFIDVADPSQKYQIGYITPGMSGTVKLKRGRWYDVQGAGDLTLRMVNVRIE